MLILNKRKEKIMSILDETKENINLDMQKIIKKSIIEFLNTNKPQPKERALLEKCTKEQKNKPKICLRYVELKPINKHLDKNKQLSKTFFQSETFNLPDNMSFDDACKVISYLSEQVEREQALSPTSLQSIDEVRKLLPKYGFKEITKRTLFRSYSVDTYSDCPQIEEFDREDDAGIIPIYTLGGDLRLFYRSKLYNSYFNWYTTNVEKEELRQIYSNINIQLSNIENESERI